MFEATFARCRLVNFYSVGAVHAAPLNYYRCEYVFGCRYSCVCAGAVTELKRRNFREYIEDSRIE